MVFASPSQFQFLTTSPRDDLISLSYLLVYLYKGKNSSFICKSRGLSHRQVFNSVRDTKKNLTADQLCGPPHHPCWQLRDFIDEVFKLKFQQPIDYNRLKATLLKGVPEIKRFDWSSEEHAFSPEARYHSEGDDSPDTKFSPRNHMKPKRLFSRYGLMRECEGSNESDYEKRTMETTPRSKRRNFIRPKFSLKPKYQIKNMLRLFEESIEPPM